MDCMSRNSLTFLHEVRMSLSHFSLNSQIFNKFLKKKSPPFPNVTKIQKTVQLLTSGHKRMDGRGLHISVLLVPRKERPKQKYKSANVWCRGRKEGNDL